MYAEDAPRPANACEWTAYAVFVVLLGALAIAVPEAVVFFGAPAMCVGAWHESAPKAVRRLVVFGEEEAKLA